MLIVCVVLFKVGFKLVSQIDNNFRQFSGDIITTTTSASYFTTYFRHPGRFLISPGASSKITLRNTARRCNYSVIRHAQISRILAGCDVRCPGNIIRKEKFSARRGKSFDFEDVHPTISRGRISACPSSRNYEVPILRRVYLGGI